MYTEPNQQSSSSSRIVDSSLKAIERLIDGGHLLFHSRNRHLDHPLTELYDSLFKQQQFKDDCTAEIGYQNISQSCKKSIDQFVSSIKVHFSENVQDYTRYADYFPIFDERTLDHPSKERKPIIGILIALSRDVYRQQSDAERIEIRTKLMESAIPLLQEACYADQSLAKNEIERQFFTSLIQLNRIAPSEAVEKVTVRRGKAKHIFNFGAKILHQYFAPHVKICAIFDASSVRYINPTESSDQSSGGSSKKSFAISESIRSKSDRKSEMEEKGSERYFPSSPSSTRATNTELFAKVPFQNSKNFNSSTVNPAYDEEEEEGEEEGEEEDDDEDDPSKSSDTPDPFHSASNLNDFVSTTEGQVICSFEQSKQKVALLGLLGDKQETYNHLDGNLIRKVMAECYSSILQNGSDSKMHCEIENFSEDEEKVAELRKALQVTNENEGILSASCFDNTGQPSFMIILLFKRKEFIYDNLKRQIIELIGMSLSNALLHIRAEELAQAQNIFTQKVQHELRTPLHGILGVNEAIMYTLRHAQDQAQDNAEEVFDSLLTELLTYSQSVHDSADILSALVDDLVDFSIPFSRLDGAENEMSKRLQRARDRRVIPLKTLFSALSSTCEKRWQLQASNRFGSIETLPEFFFWVSPLFQTREIFLKIDLDALRRVLVKLMTNALEATTEGIIHVEVSLEDIQTDQATQMMQPSDHSEVEFKKKYGKGFKHILTMTVRDSGHGMSKKFLSDQIFQAYQKEDINSPGIGLSLAFCRMTIEQMGGHIVADSEIGIGTTMKIALPVVVSEKKANIPLSIHRESNASQITAIPDLSAVFIGCKNSKSLLALQHLLINKLEGVIDGTDSINYKKDDKIDVLFIFSDGIEDWELNSWLASERLRKEKDNEIPLTIVLSNEQRKSERVTNPSELLDRIYSLSHEVKETQRPLGYKELQELVLWIKQCHHDPLRAYTQSPEGKKDSFSSSEKVNEILEDMEEQASDEITTPLQEPIDEDVAGLAISSPPFKVLVVEDNQVNAKIVTAFLRKTKIDFIEARDGEEGLELFKRDLPAVILLDINMPKMNGFDAAIAMRAHPSPYKHHIAALTALSSEADRLRGFKVGMDAWYTKPLRMAVLMEEIQKLRDVYESSN